MMRVMNRKWIVVGCLLVGVFVGAVGADVVETARRNRSLDIGLFTLNKDSRASFYVTLNGNSTDRPATVRMQFFDAAGSSVAAQDVVLQPGQSGRLSMVGPVYLRAQAYVLEDVVFTSSPALLGTVEVLDLTTQQRGPVCTVYDNGVDVGRQ